MKKISELDENFIVETQIVRDNLQFYDAEEEPFRIYGLMRENDRFCRIPECVAKSVSESFTYLYTNTAGGRVRFVTNSPYIAISADMDGVDKMPHMPLTGSAGFDLYYNEGERDVYCGAFVPPYDMTNGYESIFDFSGRIKRTITIHFPLYANVKKLYIGLDKDSILERAQDYRYEQPIVYYGSSITQGGCVSRPGNCYQNMITRWLDVNHINLGFSGSAMAEKEMCEYLADMDMSMFVCDYDHNAPSVEHLRNTHLQLYRTIRAKQPELPILFMSAPTILLRQEMFRERREVIMRTYQIALSEGDCNVYFIDGAELFAGDDWDICTVDWVHPNDMGFYRMATRIRNEIAKILKLAF